MFVTILTQSNTFSTMLTFIITIALVLLSTAQAACPTAGETFAIDYMDDVLNIQTDNYPDSYNNNSNCQWQFSGPDGSRIVLKIVDFDTESCCDKFALGSGIDSSEVSSQIVNIGGRLTANKAFASTGSQLWAQFTTDAETNQKGFRVQVAAYPANEVVSCPDGNGAVHQNDVCQCDTPPEGSNCECHEVDEFQCYNERCIPKTSKCNGFPDCTRAEDEINCHASCPSEGDGYLEYGDIRVISSESYPVGRYSDNIHCRWIFSGPEDSVIVVKFEDSEVQKRNDFIFIGSGADSGDKGSIVHTLSGPIREGSQYASEGAEFWMTFQTDEESSAKGFRATIKPERAEDVFHCFNGSGVLTVENICDLEPNCESDADEYLCDCEVGQFQCYNGRCIEGAKRCDSRRDCNQGEDEINCDKRCPDDKEIFSIDMGSPLRLTSLDYPEEYPPNVHCRWRFESPEGTVLVTKVVNFDVDDSGRDKLVLGSGSDSGNSSKIVAEFTGQVRSGVQHSSFSNEGWITFFTDHDRSDSPKSWTLEISAARADEVFVCFAGSGVITIDNVCDFEINCETEYDELLCDCIDGDFQCYNERCVQADRKCNGEIDCNLGEDEINCHNSCPQSDEPMVINYGDRYTITSDGYPDNYGDNIHCRWLFTGPPDSVIMVKFDDFQLDLQNDKVIVGDGHFPGNLTSIQIELTGVQYQGRQQTSVSPDLWMTFFTNPRRNARGFTAEVFAKPSAEVFQCFDGSGMVTIDDVCDSIINCETAADEYLCDCEESEFQCYNTRCLEVERKCDNRIDCEQGEDELNCHGQCPTEDKIVLDFDSIHEVSSANYPQDYANNMHCRWRFQGPPDSVVVVRVMDFKLNRYGDRLVLGSGNFSGDLTTKMIELTDDIRKGVQYASSEDQLWLTFFSNFHGTAKGFRLEVFAKPQEDVLVCFDKSGVITEQNICDEIVNCLSEADELPCVCRSDQFRCQNGRCISENYRCDNNLDCSGGEDEANCHEDCPTSANVTLEYETPMVLQSANHPDKYHGNTHCMWLLNGPPNAFLKIKVREFNLENLRDTLRIGYGLDPGQSHTVLDILTGSIQRDLTILVTSQHAWMTFVTDGTVNLEGFSLEVVASRKIDSTTGIN